MLAFPEKFGKKAIQGKSNGIRPGIFDDETGLWTALDYINNDPNTQCDVWREQRTQSTKNRVQKAAACREMRRQPPRFPPFVFCLTAVTAIHSAQSTCHSQSGGSGCAAQRMVGASVTHSPRGAETRRMRKVTLPASSNETGAARPAKSTMWCPPGAGQHSSPEGG